MSFFKSNIKEILSFLLLLAVFLVAGRVLQWIDPSAGTIDLGWLQVLISGLLKAALGLVGVWMLLEAGFPSFRDYVNPSDDPKIRNFRQDFMTSLPTVHRVWVFVVVFVALLAFVAMCLSNA